MPLNSALLALSCFSHLLGGRLGFQQHGILQLGPDTTTPTCVLFWCRARLLMQKTSSLRTHSSKPCPGSSSLPITLGIRLMQQEIPQPVPAQANPPFPGGNEEAELCSSPQALTLALREALLPALAGMTHNCT